MIKAVLFDFDGVLTTDKYGSVSNINYLTEKTGLPREHIELCYYKYNNGLLYGKYTYRDIWDDFCGDLGIKLEFDVLNECFESTPLDFLMLDIVKKAHTRYKTGMVTDNMGDRIKTISKKYDFDKIFDVICVSANYRSGKDHSLIFEKTITALNVAANECLFIDNTAKNLIVPGQMGMATILFDDKNRNRDDFINKKSVYVDIR